ncbi:hypothetical protein K402DRAFT_67847 [Aulographum hederae CBS 113979]|uniref:Uncharacterized protein n=1 Tax=Aulographum hederae CBS 113979 TaxID=1176131 RepID=A0A6G1H1G9_9PEZI|nr:hypothetical protein K402DRAFT_67847 [Aulographum hederae CBS 113979]
MHGFPRSINQGRIQTRVCDDDAVVRSNFCGCVLVVGGGLVFRSSSQPPLCLSPSQLERRPTPNHHAATCGNHENGLQVTSGNAAPARHKQIRSAESWGVENSVAGTPDRGWWSRGECSLIVRYYGDTHEQRTISPFHEDEETCNFRSAIYVSLGQGTPQ